MELLLAEDNPATGRNKNLESLVSGHVREINYVCAERNLSTTRSLVVFGTRTMYLPLGCPLVRRVVLVATGGGLYWREERWEEKFNSISH